MCVTVRVLFLLLFSLLYHIPIHTHIHPTHSNHGGVMPGDWLFCLGSQYTHTYTPKKMRFMVRRDGAEIRRERIQKITTRVLKILHGSDGELSLSRTLSALEYETGLTREKLLEYLGIGADTGHFVVEVENDKIGIYRITDSERISENSE